MSCCVILMTSSPSINNISPVDPNGRGIALAVQCFLAARRFGVIGNAKFRVASCYYRRRRANPIVSAIAINAEEDGSGTGLVNVTVSVAPELKKPLPTRSDEKRSKLNCSPSANNPESSIFRSVIVKDSSSSKLSNNKPSIKNSLPKIFTSLPSKASKSRINCCDCTSATRR